MGDDSNDEGSEEGSQTSTKKKKKSAFGTSSKPVYSDYAHISNESDVAFARYLAATKNVNAGPEERDESKKRIRVRAEVDEAITKVEGKFVLKGLIDIQSKNLNEKADLEQKIYDQDLVYEEMMERYSLLEESLKLLQQEEVRLEDEKIAAKAKYLAYEKQKLELAMEKDGFAARTMVIETDRGVAYKDLRAAQKALADAMWRGKRTYGSDDDENSLSSLTSSMKIRKSGKKQIDDDYSLAPTTYTSQARSAVCDVMELSYKLPSKPYYELAKLAIDSYDERLKNAKKLDRASSKASSGSYATVSTDPTFNFLTSPINTVRSRHKMTPVSNTDRLRKVGSSLSPETHSGLSRNSYKGYTPCGLESPRKINHREQEMHHPHMRSIMKDHGSSSYYGNNYNDDNQSIGDHTFNSQVTMSTIGNGSIGTANGTVKTSSSAPGIFYSEKSRREVGRATVLGRVRTRGRSALHSAFGDDYFDTMPNKSLTSAGIRSISKLGGGSGRGVKFGIDDDR